MQRVSLRTFLSVILILSIIGVSVFRHPNSAHADTYNLYASHCEGGWEHAEYATGSPDVLGPQVAQFNEQNSAILRNGQQSQISCGDFHGEVSVNTAPKRVFAKFSWAATYPSEARAIEEARIEEAASGIPDTTSITPPESTVSAPRSDGVSASELIEQGSTSTVASSTAITSTSTQDVSSSTTPVSTQEIAASTTVSEVVDASAPPESDSTASSTPPTTVEASAVPITPSEPESSSSPTDAPPPVSPPAPATSEPLSLINYFIHSAFAEEVFSASNTVAVVEPAVTQTEATGTLATSSLEIPPPATTTVDASWFATSSGASTSTSIASTTPYGLVEAIYSFDDMNWKSLGYVADDEFDTKEFEIPVDEIVGWEDVSNLKIGVRSVPTLDAVMPIIYLDAVWLAVEYERVGDDPHPAPSLLRGDTYLREVAYSDGVAVLVSRPILNDLPIYNFATTSASSSDVVVLAEATTTTAAFDESRIVELWLHSNTEKRWSFIADRKQVSADSKIFFDFGNIFWLGKDGALWKYNISSNSFESSSPNEDGSVAVEFRDESSGLKKFILENGATTPIFEDMEGMLP
ncbi:MAG TPA: hypothetical protein VJ579_02785 [Candidatus Paceibacterota bacterium]|nr:hypothetical protein [Candidatus Paceibacterota bacterium]